MRAIRRLERLPNARALIASADSFVPRRATPKADPPLDPRYGAL
jgi:hypothetical protein